MMQIDKTYIVCTLNSIMVWWNRAITKDEYTELFKMLQVLNVRQVKHEAQIDEVEQKIKVLRGFVNKKLKLDYDEPDEEEIPVINDDHDDGFDSLRQLKKIHG